MSYQDPTDLAVKSGKKKIVRRKKDDDDAGASEGKANDFDGATQTVHSVEEGDALVSRVRQLEKENVTMARTLTNICDENARLSKENLLLQGKITNLSTVPFAGTSVLQSLFEPEKTGWFGGSKAAAKDQIQKLLEALQSEFLEYKTSHSATEEEVLALVTAVQDTTLHNQELSKIIQEQQTRLSEGEAKIQIRILPVEDVGSEVAINEIKAQLTRAQNRIAELNDELIKTSDALQLKCNETIKLQNDIKMLRDQASSGSAGVTSAAALSSAGSTLEIKRLQQELDTLRESLKTEEKMHKMKSDECDALNTRLNGIKAENDAQMAKLRENYKSTDLLLSSTSCKECQTKRQEIDDLKKSLEKSKEELQALKTQMVDAASKHEKNSAGLEAKLIECQKNLSLKQSEMSRTVSSDQYSKLELEKKTLEHEVSLCKDRIKYLEDMNAKRRDAEKGTVDADDLDTSQVLQTLSRNKEKISKLEFETQQLQLQLQQAQTYAVSRDTEAKRLERSTAEDKQRVAFLLKKCATVSAESKAAVAEKNNALEQLEEQRSENKKLSRQLEELTVLKEQNNTLRNDKRLLEERIASTAEVEEKLVKAKETIAYMELAQSKTINMSQYAELQASRDKLENSVAPLKKQLDEAQKEITRLKSITDAQQTVSFTQKNSVQGWQDKVNQLSEQDAKMREQVQTLTAENERLTKLNESLEMQMADMQDGIKEMAVKMEENRSSAKLSAEQQSEMELTKLRSDLERANNIIANVQTSNSQFVSEALYKAVVEERDKLKDEIAKKSSDTEKLKSEILIYRQTIADLESENDEHVKQIEQLQERYQQERTSLSDRLSAEQKRVSDLKDTIGTLKEEGEEKDKQLENLQESVKKLEEQNNKQRRAFEDKCRSEEALKASLESLQRESGRPVEMPAASALSSSPMPSIQSPTLDSGSPEKLYQLQCENDRLKGDLKRLQLRSKQDADEDERTIVALQAQIKNKLSGDDRTAYETEINRSKSLKKRIEELNKELEEAKKNNDSGRRPSSGMPLFPSGSPLSDSNAELEKARAEIKRLTEHIEDLEQQLEHGNNNNSIFNNSSLDPAAGTPRDVSGTGGERPKKKVKKVKKKKASTLAEQVDGNTPETFTPRPDKSVNNSFHDTAKLEAENEALRKENASLTTTINNLNDELDAMQEELDLAHRDLEKERAEIHNRVSALEDADRFSSRQTSSAHVSRTNSVVNVSFTKQNLQDVEMQLRCAKDENARLTLELKQLSSTAVGSEAAIELKKLRSEVRRKDAEINALTEQLMPTKQKLVEYMAMADRLGLSYPFPAELEGTTVMRLKAIKHTNRAVSAPQGRTANESSLSPPPKPAPKTRGRGRQKKVEFPDEDEEFSLR